MHGLTTVLRRGSVIAWWRLALPAVPRAHAIDAGDRAVPFRLPDLAATSFIDSDSLLRRPEWTLLVFWNTGCPDCLGDLVATATYGSDADTCGPRLVGVCTDREHVGDARRFAQGVALELDNLWDRRGSAAAAYGAEAVSYAAVLVDPGGTVRLTQYDHPESITALLERIWELACGIIATSDGEVDGGTEP